MKKNNKSKVLYSLRGYMLFFFTMCLILSCNLVLFIKTLENTSQIQFTDESIRSASVITFINIVFLGTVCALIDMIRNRITVDRPMQRIADASEKVMQGDLSVRIEKNTGIDLSPQYNEIIDQINRMIEELSGMETLRTDFIANVSHELKTPMAVINNYGTLLQQKDLTEEQRIEYAKAITDASRNMSDMVQNILKLNKLENQNVYPSFTEYDLSEQICESLLSFEAIWEKKGLDIETDIEEGVIVKADPELLELVWNNLLSNAFKFTDTGSVSVSLKTEGDLAVVKIQDTGCGIRPEAGKHIFEKFYQSDTSHATKGNGLGLALVKRVIDIMHGEISVESTEGQGSTFTVKIERKLQVYDE